MIFVFVSPNILSVIYGDTDINWRWWPWFQSMLWNTQPTEVVTTVVQIIGPRGFVTQPSIHITCAKENESLKHQLRCFRIIVVDVISPLLLPLALAWSQLSNTEPPQPARRNNSHPPTYSSAHRILRLCRKIVVVSATTKVHWHQSTMVRWYGIQHSKGRQRTESLSTIIVGDCYHWLRLRSHQFLHPYLCMSCCSES